MTQAIDQFRNSIAAAGLTVPPEIHADGKLHRFSTNGKPTDLSGWYVFYGDDLPAGSFGCWRSDVKLTWCAKPDNAQTDAERLMMRDRLKAVQNQRDAEQAERQTTARQVAAERLAKGAPAIDHPYLTTKGIQPHGARADGDTLLIPMRDTDGTLHSLQRISGAGEKRFLSGGRVTGCYFSIGKPDGLVIVCEGFATGASLHEATGHAVAIAFNAGNLETVATALRTKYPDMRVLIAADDDHLTEGNPGLTKATASAHAVNGDLVVPVFSGDRPAYATDFNDMCQLAGAEAVRACIDAAIREQDKPDFDAAVRKLALLRPHEYDRERLKEAKRLSVQQKTLDAAVREARTVRDDAAEMPFTLVDAWPEPIDLAGMLTEIAATVQRFIICEPETATAAALWVAMTWVIDVVQIAPLAVITAPEKRCGKSEFKRLLAKIVNRPLEADGMSASVLFRGYDLWKPTLLVDEFDTFVKDDEDLRGIFNAGHQRGGCVWRCVGDDHTPKRFDVFGAKALAGIGKLPDTMMDRAILLKLRRKLNNETVDRLRYAEERLFTDLQRRLARFAVDYSEAVRLARPNLPAALNDRAQDNWESLLAIADCAGGVWPEKARKAALTLSGEKVESKSIGVELLADIQEIFKTKQCNRISSADLINALCNDGEKPWAAYNRGFPITPRQVVTSLKEFGITSITIRIPGGTIKGYLKERFKDAFGRYLTVPEKSDQLSVTPSQPNDGAGSNVTSMLRVTDTGETRNLAVTREPSTGAGCDGVTDKAPFSTVGAGDDDSDQVEVCL